MSVVKYNDAEVKLLARLMRAEAEGDGKQAMLMVGNVGINRVRARCLDFKNITSITKMVYQRPGGFECTLYSYFYQIHPILLHYSMVLLFRLFFF